MCVSVWRCVITTYTAIHIVDTIIFFWICPVTRSFLSAKESKESNCAAHETPPMRASNIYNA